MTISLLSLSSYSDSHTFSSRGTVVPPLCHLSGQPTGYGRCRIPTVTKTTFLPASSCRCTNARTFSISCWSVGGGGWVAKYSSAENVVGSVCILKVNVGYKTPFVLVVARSEGKSRMRRAMHRLPINGHPLTLALTIVKTAPNSHPEREMRSHITRSAVPERGISLLPSFLGSGITISQPLSF